MSQYKPVPAGEVKVGQRVKLVDGTTIKIASKKYRYRSFRNEIVFTWHGSNAELIVSARTLLRALLPGRPAGSRNKPKAAAAVA